MQVELFEAQKQIKKFEEEAQRRNMVANTSLIGNNASSTTESLGSETQRCESFSVGATSSRDKPLLERSGNKTHQRQGSLSGGGSLFAPASSKVVRTSSGGAASRRNSFFGNEVVRDTGFLAKLSMSRQQRVELAGPSPRR